MLLLHAPRPLCLLNLSVFLPRTLLLAITASRLVSGVAIVVYPAINLCRNPVRPRIDRRSRTDVGSFELLIASTLF